MEDVIVFITNIIAVNDDDSHMIINILMNIADLLSLTECKSFDEKYKGSKYMAYTLVVYAFNILASFLKSCKDTKGYSGIQSHKYNQV